MTPRIEAYLLRLTPAAYRQLINWRISTASWVMVFGDDL